MVGLPDLGVVPMPAAAFEVTQGLFLPVARGVFAPADGGQITNQTPRFVKRLVPDHAHMAIEPALGLEHLPAATAGFCPACGQLAQLGINLLVRLKMRAALYPKQIRPV